MQIIKLAANRMVKIRVTIDYKSGEMDVRVVGNPNGEGCSDAEERINEKLLQDLMESEIPGFGEMEILDSGLTEEGHVEKNKQRTKPLPFNPMKGPKVPVSTPGSPMPQMPIPEGQLDTGFGV